MLDQDLRLLAERRNAGLLSMIADRAAAIAERMVAAGSTADDLTGVIEAAADAGAVQQAGFLSTLLDLDIPAGVVDRAVIADAVRKIAAVPAEQLAAAAGAGAATVVHHGAAASGDNVPGVKLWLRRVKPGEVCGLCIQAASRVYLRGTLAPVHDHCRCTVRPILPGEQIADLIGAAEVRSRGVQAELNATRRELGHSNRARSRASNQRVNVPEEGS